MTIRQVNLDNNRGLLIVGDSNTKQIEFGSGKGKVGDRYPGKRVKAATIDDINPSVCSQHRNITLICGTNDLRPGGQQPDIQKLVKSYACKVQQIKKINPQCNVFVFPVLPTRDYQMNRYVTMFNRNLNSP